MTKLIIAVIAAYWLGKWRTHVKNRVQCVNCGGHNTRFGAAGYGGVKGSICGFAVKHWEGHRCKDCDKLTSVKMTLGKS